MKRYGLSIILFILLLGFGMLSLFVGVIDVPVSSLLSFQPDAWEIFILSRLPRFLAILCAGSGLSIAGLLMQQLTANKFVAPSTGATITSSQLGILIALLFLPSSTLVSRAIFAFAFAMLGTFLFIWFIHNIKLKETVLVPLIGIMFSNIIGGITSFLAFRFEMTQVLSTWLVGHFSLVIKGRYEIVFLVVPLICIALLYANHFNIVGMGKDFSKNLGVNYTWILILGLMIAAMLTASIVVVVGSISYIGLIVPNMITILKGDKLQNT